MIRGRRNPLIRGGAFLVAVLFFLWAPSCILAQERAADASPSPGESLRVSLVTIGQGDVVWERFGHNAILIQDVETGWEASYNWGVFNFHQVDFIPRLIRGTMLYSMGVYDYQASLSEYRRVGRPVWIQELALTPSQRLELLSQVEENYRPENRDYLYDYYRDNCSTRVRDALDRVLGGRMEALFSVDTTAHSFRWHTRRILRALPEYYLGIQFVLGPRADRPITVWEEMFLPLSLMNRVREIQVPDGDGGLRSLVVEERKVLDPARPDPPGTPPFAFPLFLVVGLLWAWAILWLSGVGAGGPWRRLGLALLAGGWGLIAALSGSLLLGSWLFTDHVFWYGNFNLFQANPLFFPIPIAFLAFLFTGVFPKWGRDLAFLLCMISLAGVVLELLPWLGQSNSEVLGLMVPVNLAFWISSRRVFEAGDTMSTEGGGGPAMEGAPG